MPSEREPSDDCRRRRRDVLGRLACGFAHDLNNKLTAITGFSQLLTSQSQADPKLASYAAEVSKNADAAAAVTRRLLEFSRGEVTSAESIDLRTLFGRLEVLARAVLRRTVSFDARLGEEPAYVRAPRGLLEEAILSLVLYANDTAANGARIVVEIGRAKRGERALLAVVHEGAGSEDESDAAAYRSVEEVVTSVGGTLRRVGARLEASFPRERSEGTGETAAPDEASEHVPSETVLLVDDEASVRKLAAVCLQKLGLEILAAADGEEAVEIAGRYEGTIHLLLTDVLMPGMTGPELATRLLAKRPEMKVLFMSGFTDGELLEEGLGRDLLLVEKPFTLRGLSARVQDVLAGA